MANDLRDLLERLRFIEHEADRAWDLTDPEYRLHVVVIESVSAPPVVACSWPYPPAHARPHVDIETGGRL